MDEENLESLSLEDIKQFYATGDGDTEATEPDDTTTTAENSQELDADDSSQDAEEHPSDLVSAETMEARVSPEQIVEAALFVGNPENLAVTAKELAAIMRGVDEAEVADIVRHLNESYAANNQAMRIVESAHGYQMKLVDELNEIKQRFYGKTREIALSQAAIDCLSLVAYQPGISREEIDNQRGQSSGGMLSQLVRRQLLELRRSPDQDGTNRARYYPTQRFLQLIGVDSLDDLPTVEEYDPSMPLFTG